MLTNTELRPTCLKVCGTMQEAREFVRQLVYKDCGDWILTNKMMRDKTHDYIIMPQFEIDDEMETIEVYGYEIHIRTHKKD